MRARTRTARKAVVLAAVASLGAGLLAGCADDGEATVRSGDSDGGGKTTITLGLFGTMGFKEAGLYTEYEKLHPNIKISQTTSSSGTRTTTRRW